jgi:hypothetical protein
MALQQLRAHQVYRVQRKRKYTVVILLRKLLRSLRPAR